MADVFVSYKAEDRARVRPLVDALVADGLAVWWDAHIGAGDEWRESIVSNLDSAKCVIVVWSKKSVGPDGRFVRDEATRAVKRGIYLPVTIDKVDPPLGFGETQCLPLTGWKGDRDDARYLALLDRTRRIVGGDKGAAPPRVAAVASASPQVARRGVLVGGGVAALAVAGGAGWYFLKGSPASASSVAVLPFANLSGDPTQAYFSDGLAEELRSSLSRISGLKVIGRSSSEQVRDDDSKTAASKLDVSTIVTGSVRRSPTMIRVSAQLVDGSTGVEKWSQTFDRPNGDVLQIQTSIAEAVAQQLQSQLGAAAKAAIAVGGTTNAEAQDLVLKADANVQTSREAVLAQLALYDAAIALDPNYAAAYVGKARAGTSLVGYFATSTDDLDRGLAAAEKDARKAIALAPNYPEAHAALAYNRTNVLDFQTAWTEFQRALELPGCSSRTKLGIASFVTQQGGQDRAKAIIQSVQDDDPLNPRIGVTLGYIAIRDRRYAEAISYYEKYLAQAPDATGARAWLALALYLSGRYDDAEREAAKLPRDFPGAFVCPAIVAARKGDNARAQAILDETRKRIGDTGKYQYAEILATMGKKDEALTELEGALRLRDPGFGLLPTDPLLDPLRGDPRFKAVVAKINYPVVS